MDLFIENVLKFLTRPAVKGVRLHADDSGYCRLALDTMQQPSCLFLVLLTCFLANGIPRGSRPQRDESGMIMNIV